jgi:hypothetical protein
MTDGYSLSNNLCTTTQDENQSAARKSVKTFMARRQFGGIANGQFAVLVGTIGSSGQTWM